MAGRLFAVENHRRDSAPVRNDGLNVELEPIHHLSAVTQSSVRINLRSFTKRWCISSIEPFGVVDSAQRGSDMNADEAKQFALEHFSRFAVMSSLGFAEPQ